MTILCGCGTEITSSLTDISKLAQVIIAIANLFLAGNVLLYTMRKDKRAAK